MCLAVPGQVMEIKEGDELMRMAKVQFGGVSREVNLAYTPEAKIGDYVIVHVGFAISIVDQDEAQQIFETLAQLGELEQE